MANRIGARPLVEGALLAALTVVITLVGAYIPPLALAALFIPAPMALAALRHGVKVSLVSLAAAMLILGSFRGLQLDLFVGMALAASGIPMGLGARRGWKITLTLALVAVVLAASTALSVFGTLYLTGINPMDEILRAQMQSAEMVQGLMDRYPFLAAGEGKAYLEGTRQSVELFQKFVLPLAVPGLAMLAVMEYGLVRWLLRRLRADLPSVPQFRTWRMPAEAALLVVPALLVQLLGSGRVSPELATSLMTGSVLMLAPFYLIGGAALAYAMLLRLRLSRGLAGLLLFLTFPLLGNALWIVGLADSFVDFRLMLERTD